jgi:4-amino-4-deoxy-L-arabinose transferase-like glycosyltransferase
MMYVLAKGKGVESAEPASDRAPSRPAKPKADVERTARMAVVLATVWFAAALSWGIVGPIGAGHDAVIAARGIVADNMLSWHIWGPVRNYALDRPGVDQYYLHHPFGSFWLVALCAKLFGRHIFAVRLAPILLSTATPPLLYGIGRALWSPIAGALAAVTYTVLPITLAFGNFPGFEVPVTFGCLLTAWGYLRFAQQWKTRWMAVSLAGVAFAVNSDWEAYIFLGLVLAVLAGAALFAPAPWFGRFRYPHFMRWWGLSIAIAGATLCAYAVFIAKSGAIDALLYEAGKRSRGNETPLEYVLGMRHIWIDVTFTPLAILVGKVALPLFLFRFFVLRRMSEIFPLAVLAMAAFQYVAFKNGADVHIYWPMPFAPYAALSVGVLAETSLGLLTWIWRRTQHAVAQPAAHALLVGTLALIPLVILPDGVRALRYARETGGRFNEKGKMILRDYDKMAALEWMAARMEPRTLVLDHDSMKPTWDQDWVLHTQMKRANAVPADGPFGNERYFLADMRYTSADDQHQLASQFHVVAVGPFLMVDRAAPPAPVEAYTLSEREPNPLEWYLVSGWDPIRTVRPDPWYTWELRNQYDQTPNDVPSTPPSTPEELRIAHNAALATGDESRAKAYEDALRAQLRTSISMPFTDGTALLGERFTQGAAKKLALYFRAAGPMACECLFHIDSSVEAREPLSLVPQDTVLRVVGEPFWLAPKTWKRGYIYSAASELRQRPGTERFVGFFESDGKSPPPRAASGNGKIELVVLR